MQTATLQVIVPTRWARHPEGRSRNTATSSPSLTTANEQTRINEYRGLFVVVCEIETGASTTTFLARMAVAGVPRAHPSLLHFASFLLLTSLLLAILAPLSALFKPEESGKFYNWGFGWRAGV